MVAVHEDYPDIIAKYELTNVVPLSDRLHTSTFWVIVWVNHYGQCRYARVVTVLLEHVHGLLEVCRIYFSDAILLWWKVDDLKVH